MFRGRVVSTTEIQQQVKCPECGAMNDRPAARCWICGRQARLPPADERNVTPILLAPAGKEFGGAILAWLLLIVAFSAAVVGAYAESPAIGIALTILVAPALVVTLLRSVIRRAGGRPLPLGSRIATFFCSLIAVAGIASVLAAIAALAVVIAIFQFCTSGQ